MGAGPVRGRFDANISLADLDEPRSAVLKGGLAGPLGAASGAGHLMLTAHNGGCRIDYRYEIHLSGRAAMIGGRMLNSAARSLINEFFRRFAASLGRANKAGASLPSWRARIKSLFGAQQ